MGTLAIKGFWLEDHATPDSPIVDALAAGLRRFMAFCGATHLNLDTLASSSLRRDLQARFPQP